MKIENQVCALEQAKRLKELGIEQKVLYQWKQNNIQTVVIDTPMAMWIEEYVPPVGNKFFAAFTVAELGVMIDWNLVSISPPYKTDSSWYMHTNEDSYYHDNEANARAQVLIYLLENNFITAEEVNKRLNT